MLDELKFRNGARQFTVGDLDFLLTQGYSNLASNIATKILVQFDILCSTVDRGNKVLVLAY